MDFLPLVAITISSTLGITGLIFLFSVFICTQIGQAQSKRLGYKESFICVLTRRMEADAGAGRPERGHKEAESSWADVCRVPGGPQGEGRTGNPAVPTCFPQEVCGEVAGVVV
ncbi:hypothetical protein AMELA_G00285650 [Ameiurus melas]|uniref:Uncharacterized protein n=1 Tax=Ameiurus melas TaxID=219545 RepID=A0A7J5ZKM0_AMEME|nr:hypothetical protein AMELA_G00285650 [Ameiurus melas]